MAAAKTKAKKKAVKKNKAQNPVVTEIIILATIAFCVFLLIGVFTQNGAGAAGSFLKKLFAGLFGLGAYILPFAAFSVCVFGLFVKSVQRPKAKAVAGSLLFLAVISFASVVSKVPHTFPPGGFLAFFVSSYENGAADNGGLVGSLTGLMLVNAAGRTGSIIFLITLALACLVALTGRSFISAVKNISLKSQNQIANRKTKTGSEPPARVKNSKPAGLPELKPPPGERDGIRLPFLKERKTNGFSKYIFDIGDESEKTGGEAISLISEELDLSGITARREPVLNLGADKKGRRELTEIFKITGIGEEQEAEAEANYGADININTAAAYEAEEEDGFDEDGAGEDFEPDGGAYKYEYVFPPVDFLSENPHFVSQATKSQIIENSKKLEDALKSFGVEAKVTEVNVGPTVTRYELSPGQGVKVSSISKLSDDLALNLAAMSIRVEAPIPGKAAVGIEISNAEPTPVYLREVIADARFKSFPSKLAFALGKDIAGNVVVADIAKMPHMLIAGATGSGKSVCINTLITSLIYKANPDEVKLLMIDPKVVELKIYNGIPHLLIPVVTDPKKAAGALNWAVAEMTKRYGLFAESNARDLKSYNAFITENGEGDPLPQIVIIIDELSDLMMTSGKEVESAICRLAQMARASGIHLIIATQRPSVDVITGLIKANIPSKIAFSVSSGIDSRTILGENGAERLLGRGDMLFYPTGMNKPMRVQGCFISEKEMETIVGFIKQGADATVDRRLVELITSPAVKSDEASQDEDEDEFMEASIEFIVRKEKASASLLQRQFRIGYNRASRLIEILEERGIVGPEDGSKPRRVLMSFAEWQSYKNRKYDMEAAR